MITCNLNKPETTLDQVKRAYSKLQHTDAALIATAIVMSGRYALLVLDDRTFRWPDDHESVMDALLSRVLALQERPATGKKGRAATEDEVVEIKVALEPNYEEGERLLGDRDDLKALLSDLLQSGVEYQYMPTDIGWQWALDRVNWNTLAGTDLLRRVRVKAQFQDKAQGTEMTPAGTKKRGSRAKAAEAPKPLDEEPVEQGAEI